jgi:Phosphotransferase enzyme family
VDDLRWRENLRVLGLSGALRAPSPGTRSARRRLESRLRSAPRPSGVVLNGRGRSSRVRASARSLGIDVEREFLAFPSHTAPAYLVESTTQAVEYFCTAIVTVPPGTTWMTLPIDLMLRTFRWQPPRDVMSVLTRNRVVVGRLNGVPPAAVATSDASAGDDTSQPTQYRAAWSYPELDDLDLVVMGGSKDPNAKVTLLGLDRSGAGPVLALKLPTTDVAQRNVDAEGRLLVEVQRRRPASVLSTIPRVRDLVTFDGRLGLVTTGMPGVPMTASYLRWRHPASPRRVSEDLKMVGRWLAAFQSGTAGPVGSIDICENLAEQLRHRFPDEEGLDVVLDALASIDGRLRLETAPRTAVHGDLWFGNVLVREGEVSGVVDWESGTIAGDPLRDLVRFALVYATYLDRHARAGAAVAGHSTLRADSWGAGVGYALDGSGWFPDLFRSFLVDGLERLGVDPRRWRDAALAGLAEIAATADELDFARHHLELLRELARPSDRGGRLPAPPTRSELGADL